MPIEVAFPHSQGGWRKRKKFEPLLPARAFAYGRVSTDQQDPDMPVQQKQVNDYYHFRCAPAAPNGLGLPFGGWHLDAAVSAKVKFKDRPEGGKLYQLVRPGDHVLVARFDRAFRSIGDAFSTIEDFLERSIYFHFLDARVGVIDTYGPLGEFIIAILAINAKMERVRIQDRRREAIKRFKDAGLKYNRIVPTGFKVQVERPNHHQKALKRLVIDPEQVQIMLRINAGMIAGESQEKTARQLTRFGIVNPQTGKAVWEQTMVGRWHRRFRQLVAGGKIPAELLEPSSSPTSTPPTSSTATP
jgi:DNA invertase Pin-like site-specific DNA recombinase